MSVFALDSTPVKLTPLLDNIWRWSCFSEEKQMHFNGYALVHQGQVLLVDPPSADIETVKALQQLGTPALIFVTNRDHERASQSLKNQLNIPVGCSVLDAEQLEGTPDLTFQSGEWLLESSFQKTFQLLTLHHQKTPGETVLVCPSQKLLILGDALIHKIPAIKNPDMGLQMLPQERYSDFKAAQLALQVLSQLSFHVEAILVGDGEPILTNGQKALDLALGKLR
jgi:glyoxylase-like metal-dependent hydrolase (beta-lactamase superfamily II)